MTELNGLILIDKTQNMTSHDVVGSLRKILGTKAVGHAGTLDPMATGLLVCLVGEATKLSQYVMNEDKSYRVGIRLGQTTDSGDVTGKVLTEHDAGHLTQSDVYSAAQKLVGVLNLPVPKYSAVKISGKKLYEYARNDESVVLPLRDMTVTGIDPLKFASGQFSLDMYCAKGTYVRSWVQKLGQDLGVGATVESLRRLTSGPFSVEQGKTLEVLKDKSEDSKELLIPMGEALRSWPLLKLLGRDVNLVSNGLIPNGIMSQLRVVDIKQGVRLVDGQGGLLALLVKDSQKGLKLARVFRERIR